MANRYDRDEQWNRGEWQRGEWRGNEWRADESRDWDRSRSRNQGERGMWQRDAWGRDDQHRQGEGMRHSEGMHPGSGYENEMYGRGDLSYSDSYGQGRSSYRHGSGQGYGGEDHMNPGYGGRGAYGSPGVSTYGSNYGSGAYGSGAYGSSHAAGNYGNAWERDRSRGFGGSDYRSNWGRGHGSGSDYLSERDDWARGRSHGAGDRLGSDLSSSYGGGMDRSFDSWRQDSASNRAGYAGRGPKGYKRSDERIKEDVCDRLSMDDDVDASDITVTVRNGEVTLDGSVETRKMKHRAEDIAESVSGVGDVHNNVRVVKGLLNEVVDRVTGNDKDQHYANSGTRNSPTGTSLGQSGTSTSQVR